MWLKLLNVGGRMELRMNTKLGGEVQDQKGSAGAPVLAQRASGMRATQTEKVALMVMVGRKDAPSRVSDS